ncbi:MAG: FimV/HubP family polar landmark protein [Gammaproteobacteria bacterium]
MSNLTKTLAVLSLLAPTCAYPLGIGEIKLHSALNQNLDAEISLVLAAGERISDVKVSLAPPDKFDERGVPWSYFLSNISFEPSMRSDGSAVIKVRSREALKEPFLGLLLQVTWPKGTAYREFSLIVDPPAAYAQPTAPVMRTPEAIASVPSMPSSTPATAQVPDFVPTPASVAEPRPVTARTASRQSRQGTIMKGVYGPIRKNETLWGIAEKASRQYKVSIEQMMVAIYKENPRAFYKENVHSLLARVKIKIPDREAVIKLSREEALAEFNRQTEAWKSRAQPVTTEVVKAAESAADKGAPAETPIENQLTLAAPAEASVSEKAVITPGQEKGATDEEKAGVVAASAAANEEMQKRVAALEEQLSKMQALLTLKDQQLAAMQNQAQQAPEPVTTAIPTSVSQVPQPATPASPQTASPVSQTSTPGQESPAQTAAAVQAQPGQAVPEQVAKSIPVAVNKQANRSMQPAPEIEEESFPFGIIGGAGAAVLSLLGFFWWRKRNDTSEEPLDNESMFSPSIIYKAPETDVSLMTSAVNENATYEVNPVGESSFLSEFTPSDFDAFDTDQGEIDPISEADVYLAYGRYQQAEELMRNAIESYPERDECKLKLLEIYYAHENKAAFEAYAKELMDAGKHKQQGFWGKVTEMGSDIVPESPLFSSGSAAFAAKETVAEAPSPVTLTKDEKSLADAFAMEFDPEFDLASHDASLASPSESVNSEGEDDFADFDVSNFAEDKIEDASEERSNESIDFDLSAYAGEELNAELPQSEAGNAAIQSSGDDKNFDFDSFDFDLSPAGAGESAADTGALTFDRINLANDLAAEDRSAAYPDDINFDFDFSALEAEPEEEETGLYGVSDLTDMDELETKLDLARAYRDMGDNESAKDIVAEVLEKGTAMQKEQAQVLLAELM